MKDKQIKRAVFTAVFSAIAFLFTFLFKFKVSFLTFDFKDSIISVISLCLGPLYGVVSAFLVAFLEFLSVSDTGLYGLLMNFISSGTYALVIGLFYHYKRNFSGAIFSVILASVSVVSVMLLANYIITPYYMGVSHSDVLKLIPTLLLPFNLAKTVMNSATTLIIYKPITNALKRVGLLEKGKDYKYSVKSVVLLCVSILLIVLTSLFIILYLNGGFSFFNK